MAQKVKILAINTATDFLSAALLRDERVVAEKTAFVPRRHSALLPQFVDDVLRTAGEKFSDEIVLAISIGPGSYTGLRVGTSFVQGLCAAVGNRIVAVDTLMALAFRLAPSPVPVLVALDARAGGIYAGIFNVQG
ncbi:MAG TPA: tRNA (adenosine(37)-N6)-threonylcarbamoyltransferase complex dimerization subunit type 1 TsaB, partial [candidate division Zixibacteria bacterium]|nr:tRNA (adenosine(37)-N6)-threonylcarbamoyltransferase complex dimerization subunit type 1 TsaB [candidate division Zixibacteria bacterium]